MKYTEKIFDVTTGEETFIERDMTKEELAAYEEAEKERQSFIAAQEARLERRKAILEKLGLTEEEARLLLG